ncbi:MAG: ABC transporter ATP-binding protein [Bacteroidota bacterium]
MSRLLTVNCIRTVFGSGKDEQIAVRDISFHLDRGETVGIVGESGSGKSVTSLSIMRLLTSPGKTVSGSIDYHDESGGVTDLLGLKESEIRKHRGKDIAMIFQEPMTSLNPVLTCGYQVAEALMLHLRMSKKQAREATIRLFERVRLPEPDRIYDAYPHEISGGQKQRVMIAMAISCDPSILIADEPTTALDVTVQATILKLLKEIQLERKMGMLFITHDLGVISEIADRVLVMYKGSIVEEGPVNRIFSNPEHPYTKGLLACRPQMDKRLYRLPVISDFMTQKADGSFSEIPVKVEEVMDRNSIQPDDRRSQLEKIRTGTPILEVRNLKTWFPVRKGLFSRVKDHVKAVDDVSFDVYPGETLGLVGESGCGKSTLGRSVLRLIEPTAGKVVFRGKDFAALNGKELRKERKHLQIIFQDPYSSLNPRMTVGDAIIEPMKVHRLHHDHKNRREKVSELLMRVGLNEDHYDRYPHEFSGGQRQRICIARALALEPRFIICDESVSALDVSVQAQVLNLLNELKRDFGLTYIFISHDLSVVKFMSDRMIVMNKGKIEEEGDPDEIYASPKSEYTRRLIEAIPGISF